MDLTLQIFFRIAFLLLSLQMCCWYVMLRQRIKAMFIASLIEEQCSTINPLRNSRSTRSVRRLLGQKDQKKKLPAAFDAERDARFTKWVANPASIPKPLWRRSLETGYGSGKRFFFLVAACCSLRLNSKGSAQERKRERTEFYAPSA